MSVRQAKSSDARGIAQVQVAAWQSAYRDILPDTLLDNLSVERSERHWATLLTEGPSRILVFDQGDRVIGFVSFGVSRDDDADKQRVGEIYAIYFDPGEWRKGYGSALARAALESLKAQGCSEVTLWVLDKNERGIKFYEALGFEADGARKVETRKDGVELHEVRYRQHLDRKSWHSPVSVRGHLKSRARALQDAC